MAKLPSNAQTSVSQLNDWLNHDDEIEEYAKKIFFDELYSVGRHGLFQWRNFSIGTRPMTRDSFDIYATVDMQRENGDWISRHALGEISGHAIAVAKGSEQVGQMILHTLDGCVKTLAAVCLKEYDIEISSAWSDFHKMYDTYVKEINKEGPMGYLTPQRLVEIVGSYLVPKGQIVAVADGNVVGVMKDISIGEIVAPKNALQQAIADRQQKAKKEGKW